MKEKPETGTRVRLTSAYLRNTGQATGSEGLSRWNVVECRCELCSLGRHCATDEPLGTLHGYEDVPVEKRLRWRHFAFANLERCR